MEYASEAVMQNGFYFVYIMMSEPFAKFATQMTQFNQAVDSFLADIDTGISEYDTIRQVHDKLLDLVNYNDPVAETEHIGPGQDLAHTAYGALVADSAGNPNYAVCDGYTLAFEVSASSSAGLRPYLSEERREPRRKMPEDMPGIL